MATQIVQAPAGVAHPTAPLAPELVRAVTRFEVASARFDELSAKDARDLSPAEFDALGTAQQVIAESFGILAKAGQLHLIDPAQTATRYRQAAGHCRRLSAGPTADYDELLCVQDELAMCRCQLAKAGRLDLIGLAS
ncbi:hypothetical protein JL475_00290 [Streptomyces sp. M2CJ-2]|uniref:hypothetical protein n=1 Tax=Streptomyces sp. M2CJ-2 TaxID=2803948 RepID=UPI001921A071|nr:hypothetical protein [Streptomyces sp. M2CJ-2]MBL3664484.1 hypothetical protein [Streptomyces sp. M2CJ-2]